jgi:hypothetical protein
MLHFLAGVALCFFIGERLAHYIGIIKQRRQNRRHLALLYPPSAEPYRSLPSERASIALMITIAALVFGVALLRMAALI